jgi:uncharacterized protein (TIGR03067 family)
MGVRTQVFSLMAVLAMPILVVADEEELRRLQGKWEVIELVEDGHVIPQNAIEDWLPSGGRVEIIDSTIVSVSPHDGKREVKVFSIDAAEFPKGIEIRARDQREAWGIYQFDDDRLVICLVDHEDGSRPENFSAREGSRRMRMTLKPVGRKVAADTKKTDRKEPSEPTSAQPAVPHLASDAEVTSLLSDSVWRYKDANGALVISLKGNGTFSTVRESTQMRVFQKVFVRAPISCGDWSVQNGKLWLHVQTSVDPTRVNARQPFTLRVVTEKDMIFVDYVGHVGQAVRVK